MFSYIALKGWPPFMSMLEMESGIFCIICKHSIGHYPIPVRIITSSMFPNNTKPVIYGYVI